MKLAAGSDHAGFGIKEAVVRRLRAQGHVVVDVGATDGETSVDYPDYAHAVAAMVESGEAERGVLVCGTGLGVCMAANRHHGVRAAVCTTPHLAEMSRRHNDANVLCLGGRVTGSGVALQIVDVFLAAPFDGGRHDRRVHKIDLTS